MGAPSERKEGSHLGKLSYLRHVIFLLAVLLFLLAFVLIGQDRDTAVFVLTASGIAAGMISHFGKIGEEVPSSLQDSVDKQSWLDKLKDYDSLSRTYFQAMAVGIIFTVLYVVAGNELSGAKVEALFRFLSLPNGDLFARVVCYAIAINAIFVGGLLFLQGYFFISLMGIVVFKLVFDREHRAFARFYAMVSSIFSFSIIVTLVRILVGAEGVNHDRSLSYFFVVMAAIAGILVFEPLVQEIHEAKETQEQRSAEYKARKKKRFSD